MKNVAMALIAAYLMVEFTQPKPANAQSLDSSHLEAIAEQLNLTEGQRIAAEPILYAGFEERRSILQSAGINLDSKPSLHQMMKVRSPLQSSQARTEAQLAQVLSPEQMIKYRSIVERMRKEMKARIR